MSGGGEFPRTARMTEYASTDTFNGGATIANGSLQAIEKRPIQGFIFAMTAAVAARNSADHAVDVERLPDWFVAVRWPRLAGLTHLTRRPLPSNRHPMPSCL
jgi:hypothetical protein